MKNISDPDIHRLIRVLEEIRDNQKLQLQQQAELHAIAYRHSERAERIQDRAEQIQARSYQLVSGSRKAMLVILPIITVLIIYVSWLFIHVLAR